MICASNGDEGLQGGIKRSVKEEVLNFSLPALTLFLNLPGGFGGVGGVYQFLVGRESCQFSGLLQNIQKKVVAVLGEDEVCLPCFLLMVAGDDGGDGIKVSLSKLRRNDFGDFVRVMTVDIVHAFLQGVGEALDHRRIVLDEAGLGAEGCVGDVAGIHPQGGYHIACALLLQGCGGGFKFYGEIYITTPLN